MNLNLACSDLTANYEWSYIVYAGLTLCLQILECTVAHFKVGCTFFFLILDCEATGTAATPGLLCQPRVIVKMIVEKQMECTLAAETEVLGENLPQRHFSPSQNPT
jgi:hypothetical protein